LPHELNLRRGQGVGLVDEVAERALQVQGFSGKGAGGGDGAGVLLPQRVQTGAGLVSIVRTEACSRPSHSLTKVSIGLGSCITHNCNLHEVLAGLCPLGL